jgi:di/tripeptidase
MRSEDPSELAKLDAVYKQAVEQSLREENGRWQNVENLTVKNLAIGNRPTGIQSPDAPIVQVALAADRSLGIKSELEASSTDSNIPISLGVPAITLDGGGIGKGTHSLNESWDTTNSHIGSQRALIITLAIVGICKDKQ